MAKPAGAGRLCIIDARTTDAQMLQNNGEEEESIRARA